MPMQKTDVAKMWTLHYRLITSVVEGVALAISVLGIDVKELSCSPQLTITRIQRSFPTRV